MNPKEERHSERGRKRISENEVEVLGIDRLTVPKRKELTTCFAALFLAHPRELKRLFALPDRDVKFGVGRKV